MVSRETFLLIEFADHVHPDYITIYYFVVIRKDNYGVEKHRKILKETRKPVGFIGLIYFL